MKKFTISVTTWKLLKNGKTTITIDNVKAKRILNQFEDMLQEKIEITPEQPKYLLNCANKLFFVAEFTSVVNS